MGKGDKKSKRGKITLGSYGKLRPRNVEKTAPVHPKIEEKPEVEPEVKTEVKTEVKPPKKKSSTDSH